MAGTTPSSAPRVDQRTCPTPAVCSALSVALDTASNFRPDAMTQRLARQPAAPRVQGSIAAVDRAMEDLEDIGRLVEGIGRNWYLARTRGRAGYDFVFGRKRSESLDLI